MVRSPIWNRGTADGSRCEDRIRVAKNTGLRNLPLHDFTQNQIWCAIVALAVELSAWIQLLTLAGHDARPSEAIRLRLQLFSIAARLADHARGRRLHMSAQEPWGGLLARMITTLRGLPAPGCSSHLCRRRSHAPPVANRVARFSAYVPDSLVDSHREVDAMCEGCLGWPEDLSRVRRSRESGLEPRRG